MLRETIEEDSDKIVARRLPNNVVLFTPERKDSKILYYKNGILRGFYKGEHC